MKKHKRYFYLKSSIKGNNILIGLVLLIFLCTIFYYLYRVDYYLPSQPERTFDMSGLAETFLLYGVSIFSIVALIILFIARITIRSNYNKFDIKKYDNYIKDNHKDFEKYMENIKLE